MRLLLETGIRAGEKLHEALWERGAVLHSTSHPDILRVEEAEYPIDVPRVLASLEEAAEAGSRLAVQAALAQWLETFVPAPEPEHASHVTEVGMRTCAVLPAKASSRLISML